MKPLARSREPRTRTIKRPGHLHLKPAVFARSGGHCDLCGTGLRPDQWEAHHRQPRGMGGDPTADTSANLLALHTDCHRWVESHRDIAYTLGFLVRTGHDPATTPVKRHRRFWQLPTETGWKAAEPIEGETP